MCQSRTSNGGLGRLVASTSADFNDSGLFYLMKEEQESFHRGEDPLLSPLRDFLPALKDIQDYAPSEYFSKEFLAALKRAITLAHPTSYMLQLAIMDMQADPREILDSMDDWDDALPAPTTFPASAAVAAVTKWIHLLGADHFVVIVSPFRPRLLLMLNTRTTNLLHHDGPKM